MEPTKYINPTTDYGFKRIFGTEVNKDLLNTFLNDLFRGRKTIADLKYNKNEHVGDAEKTGSVIFDLTCTADNGEKFIIEVQRSSQVNLKRRMLYYGSKLIADEAPKGNRKEWNYGISEVYVIVLMDGFAMPDEEDGTDFLHDICLCNRETGKIFYEDLGFIYIETRRVLSYTFGVTVERQTREIQVCYLTGFLENSKRTRGKQITIGYLVRTMNKMSELPVVVADELARKVVTIELPDAGKEFNLSTPQSFLHSNGISYDLRVKSMPYAFFRNAIENDSNDNGNIMFEPYLN